jgi:uncharacterized protein (DUF58 family)
VQRSSVPEGIRITKVGLWYVLFTVVVGIAATNTGNNALYMVLALMLAVLAVSGLASRQNVRRLAVAVEPPAEIFANRPTRVRFTLTNRGRALPRWCLLFSVGRSGTPRLVPYLPHRSTSSGEVELLVAQRGRHRLAHAHVWSLFPFGFFRKGVRYRTEAEVLVFPELFSAASPRDEGTSDFGEQTSRRSGWGHELHALRAFRQGDDPRRIHWKQTARTGGLIFMERETEESRRLAILLDNGVGRLDEGDAARFERLVSEAATTAVDALGRGFEVELVTRDRSLPFASGRRQRFALLEALALLEPAPREATPLRSSDARAAELRLGLAAPAEPPDSARLRMPVGAAP